MPERVPLRAVPWLPLERITAPCADVSLAYTPGVHGSLTAVMHFSSLRDGLANDLELRFARPVAVTLENESSSLIDIPEPLPTIAKAGRYSGFTFPVLLIEGSAWADEYAANVLSADEWQAHSLKHFACVSLNDLLHVLSWHEPTVRFLE